MFWMLAVVWVGYTSTAYCKTCLEQIWLIFPFHMLKLTLSSMELILPILVSWTLTNNHRQLQNFNGVLSPVLYNCKELLIDSF